MKKLFPLLLFAILLNSSAFAQNDSIPDKDIPVQDTVIEKSTKEKVHKRVSDFKFYGGISGSTIVLSNSTYEAAYAAGYNLGFAFRKGRYGYWEVGLNFNGSVVALDDVSTLEQNMQISHLELPLSGGINLLGATRRVLGLRIYGGLVPGYVVKIGDSPFGLEKGDFNQFQLGGRVGVGLDVFFLFIEAGYQYGFIDLLTDQDSNLSQLDLRLGFRF
jgi:hypothetical protein